MPEDFPAALSHLIAELEDRDFAVVADEQDDRRFGNRVTELAHPNRETARRVRLVRDRSLWSVELEIGGKWRDPYQVLLALDKAKYSTRASSHEERVRFT